MYFNWVILFLLRTQQYTRTWNDTISPLYACGHKASLLQQLLAPVGLIIALLCTAQRKGRGEQKAGSRAGGRGGGGEEWEKNTCPVHSACWRIYTFEKTVNTFFL